MIVKLSRLAQKDIQKYGKYLMKEVSEDFSYQFSVNMTKQLRLISKNTKIGNSNVTIFVKNNNVRYFLFRKYKLIIFYEIISTHINVIRVFGTSMDKINILDIQS